VNGEPDVAKHNKPSQPRSTARGTRVLDAVDAAEFAIAAKEYVAANTVSQSAARKKLQELGFVDNSGKLTKRYR